MTSSTTSSPRLAGKQCRKMASGAACSNKARVHLVRREVGEALFFFLLLAHASPHIGVDRLRTSDGFRRVAGDDKLSARDRGESASACATNLGIRRGIQPAWPAKNSCPFAARPSISECASVVPSPTKAASKPGHRRTVPGA